MTARLPVPLLAVALLAVPLAADGLGTRAKGGGRSHPSVSTTATCEECHAEATPRPFADWKNGTHGINLVKCFVCHGSTGADFRRRPATDRCIGCHADQVASMGSAAMKGKDCFTCHSPHALDPHATTPARTTAALLGADQLAPMETVEGRIPPPAPQPAAPSQPPAAPSSQPPAAAGAEKDVKASQPHPPTDR